MLPCRDDYLVVACRGAAGVAGLVDLLDEDRLDRADAARRDELLALLARCREDEAAVDALQQAVEEQGGLQEASKVMQSYLQRATALLAEWPDGPIRSALVNLCAYVAERNR